MKKIALITLFDISGIEQIASSLVNMEWRIIATSETFTKLSKENIAVEDVKDFVNYKDNHGFPPTLHPKIEAALTNEDYHEKIDIVFGITYPLKTGNDVGGHTLLALAVKGNRIPVTDYEDMRILIEHIMKNSFTDDLKRKFQEKALVKIIKHNVELLYCLNNNVLFNGFEKNELLLSGENPYQTPSYLCKDFNADNSGYALHEFKRISDESPCYTNIADLDNLLNLLYLASKSFYKYYEKIPYISIAGKHGNPCGFSIDWSSPENSIEKALWGNSAAIWGGEFVSNFNITKNCAGLLWESEQRKEYLGSGKWMLDVIAVPGIDKPALEILGKRRMSKVFTNERLYHPELAPDYNIFKSVRGGSLIQPGPSYILDFEELKWVNESFSKELLDSYIIAWAAAYSSFHGGNEVAIAKDNCLLSVGGGPSTVEAAKIAVWRANENKHDLTESVFAADAFFPFKDAPEILKNAGCIGGVVPGGGRNHNENIHFFRYSKIEIGFIPEEFRGFCRH